MDRDELFTSLNSGVLNERLGAFRRNLEKNLPLISKHGGLKNVIPCMKGKHVIVAGAGPSLDGSIASLKKLNDDRDFIVIASDMALRALIINGVRPAYAITCETTPSGFFSGIDTASIHLLAFSCSSHSTLRKWRGEISFYNWMAGGELYNSLWNMAGNDLGFVATGSIVTTQAVSIVMGGGILSLMLAGNDLGFYDCFYSSGTVKRERSITSSSRFATLPGIEMGICRNNRAYEVVRRGRSFYTNPQFLAARLWLEELFGKEPFPVADCSYPGCSGNIVYKIGLEEYILQIKNHNKENLA